MNTEPNKDVIVGTTWRIVIGYSSSDVIIEGVYNGYVAYRAGNFIKTESINDFLNRNAVPLPVKPPWYKRLFLLE